MLPSVGEIHPRNMALISLWFPKNNRSRARCSERLAKRAGQTDKPQTASHRNANSRHLGEGSKKITHKASANNGSPLSRWEKNTNVWEWKMKGEKKGCGRDGLIKVSWICVIWAGVQWMRLTQSTVNLNGSNFNGKRKSSLIFSVLFIYYSELYTLFKVLIHW